MSLPANIKALILDMDGVLWRDTTPIGDLPGLFTRSTARGLKVALATNNSSKTVDEFLNRLGGFGVELCADQIITSALATANALAEKFPGGGPIFIIGESGIQHALKAKGFVPITDPQNPTPPVAVVVGIDRYINYPKLRRATLHIRAGAPFYATNADRTYPTPEGLVPGAGSILAAIQAAADVHPIVIGKPSPVMMEMALKRLRARSNQTLVVGDRLETDIAAGQAAGCKTALVLSGVTTLEMANAWPSAPDIIATDLEALLND